MVPRWPLVLRVLLQPTLREDYFQLTVFYIGFLLLVRKGFDKDPTVAVPPNTTCISPKSNVSKRQLCISTIGRLGNNMFLFASAFGIARMKGMQLTLNDTYLSDPLLSVFNITSIPIVSKCPKNVIYDASGSKFKPKQIDFKNDRDLTLMGYFQSWIYFVHVENELRRIFVFQDKIKEKAVVILRKILSAYLKGSPNVTSKDVSFVGIQVRRGDLLQNWNVDLGYLTAPPDYFRRSVLYIRKQFPNPIFVVCSDDIQWSKQILGHNDTYYVHKTLGIDLSVLSQCNHSISSVGTFSWWSAWFTKGIKLYYPYQSRPGSWLRKQFSQQLRDYFPFDWIPITNSSSFV